MTIIIAKRSFSVFQWLSKLCCSIFHRKPFKRLESRNCPEHLGTSNQVLVQHKLEVSEDICCSNTRNRTVHPDEKMKSHLSVVVNRLSSNISLSDHVRKPLIKFIGARLPRPHYDRSAVPSVICESKSSVSQELVSSSNEPPSAVKSTIQRGELIEDWQLPVFLRRKQISEEECLAINNGGAYGLDST
ncbi:hypothetical protein LOAG_10414 [Loa loa]|uniref:Ovule protein n=1 Tax=Loa loa TaxID=7209 RepID=A0A1I7VSF6_LOALO|nr:hypothetical protein LOAG_10414 [Loa loa]EFO18084.2 hypothetical protein LOAG_10414 [Loa loa]